MTKPHETDRPTWPALSKGWRRKCPNCGSKTLMTGYLTVADSCPVCHQDFTPQRADDGPAYLTILAVGHLIIPLIHVVFVHMRPDPLTMAAVFGVGSVALCLYMLPRFKGAVVAFQWARRMHGF